MLVDSKKHHLSMQDIVKEAMVHTKAKGTFQQVFLSIVKELTMPGAEMIRNGNTMFIFHRSKDKGTQGYFRALNADTAENYVENCRKMLGQAQKKGFDTIATTFSDPSILHIFKIIKLSKPKGIKLNVKKNPQGLYLVTILFGDK